MSSSVESREHPLPRESLVTPSVACGHCGLDVPSERVEPNGVSFCCDGCRSVHAILESSNLEDYYRHRTESAPRPAKVTGRTYEELDHPKLLALLSREENGRTSVELQLEGVHCAACVWLVEKLPSVVPGVTESRLDLTSGRVRLGFDAERVRLSEIARALDRMGYPVHPARGRRAREERTAEDRRFLIRLGVAGFVAGNVMLMAFALYGGASTGMDRELESFFRFLSLAVATPGILYSGSVFFKGAYAAIVTRTPHMDLPVAMGLLAGYLHGAYSVIRGSGEVYFDSLCVLVFLLLVGRWLQVRQTRRAADAADLLDALAPRTARRFEDGTVHEIPVEAIVPGDKLEVRAGDSVPADAKVLVGTSAIDASLLTGESRPMDVGPGDQVFAGTVNRAGRIEVQATAAGEESRLGQLVKLVEDRTRNRGELVRVADRLAGKFVVGVIALSIVTFVGWSFVDPAVAIDRVVALLVVSCPCALGLATPLAISAAIGKAARMGVLIKGGEAVERLAQSGTLFFDKTGTLTEGRLEVVSTEGDESLLPLVAAAEARVSHPIARALAAARAPEGTVDSVENEVGGGIRATVSGRTLVAGSPELGKSQATEVPDWIVTRTAEWSTRGITPVWVLVDGRAALLVGLFDSLRADAAACVLRIEKLGFKTRILSGDHVAVATRVAEQAGIPIAEGGASPEVKLQRVEAARARGDNVIMVGDGVNDAAALAAASVGVAVHGGAEASLAAAHVYLGNSGVTPLVELLEGARRTMKVIHRNLAFSLVYNIIATTLAALGVVGPLGAAVLMPISSLVVITSSYRSRTFGGQS
ncbi:MAG: heavy metal translocating P-type ATPase [Deltaproteobacteria bacterium]|nr:heavy metal translocating P-type ATPase [Deltaproteobacteria bacterium]